MSLLSVYVEGAKDASAQGVRRLAAAIAARYGLSAPDLEKRLVTGRFRVKANVDEETARAFVADLETLGARCSIAEVDAKASRGVRAMPALEQPAAPPMLSPDRAPASSRPVPALAAGELGGEARDVDGGGGRLDESQRSRSRTSTPGDRGTGAGSGAEPLMPRSATPLSPVVPRSATPIARTLASPSVPPPTAGTVELLLPRAGTPSTVPASASATARDADARAGSPSISPLMPAAPPTSAPAPGAELDPPTLRGLASPSASRTPASSQPPISRTTTLPFSGLPARAAAPPTTPPATSSSPTGLAAALADATYGSGWLGALDGATFSLSTLDGHDDPSGPPVTPGGALPSFSAHDVDRTVPSLPPSFDAPAPRDALDEPLAPPPPYESASPYEARRAVTASRPAMRPTSPSRPIEPITTFSTESRPPRLGRVSADPFAPPAEEGAAAELQLEARPARAARTPHASMTPGTPGSSQPPLAPLAPPLRGPLVVGPEGAPMTASAIAPPVAAPHHPTTLASKALRVRRLRIAFAAGVLAAVLIGFVPAHLVAQSRERAAYEKIDNRVRIAQSEITTLEEWNALDDVRTALWRQKRAAHQEIMLLSLLLWAGLAGGLVFAWVRLGLPRFDLAREVED